MNLIKIFKERNSWEVILLGFLSIVPFVPIFLSPYLIHTHDGLVHLARIAAFYKALINDHQFPVRFVGDLNYGYGMPLFNFIYPLPYFTASLFLFLGAGLVLSFKLSLFLSFFLSGIFMYLFAREFFEDRKNAFLAALFYQFASFRLIEIFTRGAFGETFAYSFMPFVILGITRIDKKQTVSSLLIVSFGTAFLVLSHNSVSLLFFGAAVLFSIFFASSFGRFLLVQAALFAGLLLSAFYWLPAILEHKYTYGDLFMKSVYLSNFPNPLYFIIPNFTYNKNFLVSNIPVQFGIFPLSSIALSFVLFKRLNTKYKRLIIFCSLLLLLSIFFMLSVSTPLWQKIALLRQFQFPWRFMAMVVFATSLLSFVFLEIKFFRKKWIFVGVCALLILSTFAYWRSPEGADKINEGYYWNYPLNTTYYGETDTIWSAGPASSYPKSRVEVIQGDGTISGFRKKSNYQEFVVDAKTNVLLVDHTQFFPGWRIFVEEREVPVQFQDPHYRGEMEFLVPKGRHRVRLFFGETKIRLIADLLSLLTFSVLVVFLTAHAFGLNKYFSFKKQQR